LPTYEKWQKSLKMDEKWQKSLKMAKVAKWIMAKVAKNGRKVKAIALLFCCFLPTYEKWQKSLKMDEKLRL
jgi:hypothetical protein